MTALAESPARTLFAVPGLRCASCIAKLEGGLAPLPGIASARVNFTSKQVAIDHAPALRLPDLQAAIAKLGFEAQQPVVLGNSLAPRRRSRLDLARAGGDREIRDRGVLRLAAAVADDRSPGVALRR